ncbi:hypothetical protein P4S72_24645, partial [Vibrio sp. PP-XX7]
SFGEFQVFGRFRIYRETLSRFLCCRWPDRKHNDWLKSQNFYSSLASPTYYNGTFIGFVFINASEGYDLSEQKATFCALTSH